MQIQRRKVQPILIKQLPPSSTIRPEPRPTAGSRPARLMLYTTPAAARAASIKHQSKQPRIKRRHKKETYHRCL